MSVSALALVLASAMGASSCASGPSARPGAAGTPTAAAGAALAAAADQVESAERAFAQTMARRDLKAFLSFVSEDAIFFSGNTVEHGPAEIANVWAPYFSGPRAPFSWHPDHVEVTPDGRLALSTGPVMQEGRVVGRFNSVWRLEGQNTWHVVFDKGEAVCGPPGPGGAGAAH